MPEANELVMALFREYLIVNKFDLSAASFKTECEQKGVRTTITKRTQMVEMLDLTEQVVVELKKKRSGQEYIKSTLELLIMEYLKSNETLQTLRKQNGELRELLAGAHDEHNSEQRGAKKRIRKPRKEEQQGSQNEAPQDFDNIWNMPKQVSVRPTCRVVPSAPSTVLLKAYIDQHCGESLFFMTLFKDKRIRDISDNWYQGLRCVRQGTPTDLLDPRTYNIKQLQGGPCGFIATTQARAYKYLFQGATAAVHPKWSATAYDQAIINALYDAFRVISKDKYVLVLPSTYNEKVIELSRVIQEMDKFVIVEYGNAEALQGCLESAQFGNFCFGTEISSFIPCMVLSYLFTRGINNISEQDFDAESNTACGSIFSNYNNCSQELVNLLITGRAVAGVHDGELDLDGYLLKGVPKQADIGLLSIFEAYDYLTVGRNYKLPVYPTWVCFNEAHFTVLRGTQDILTSIQRCNYDGDDECQGITDFGYYDGLDDQKTTYRITTQYNSDGYEKHERDSYVENLIQTLLPASNFNWHGADPLL